MIKHLNNKLYLDEIPIIDIEPLINKDNSKFIKKTAEKLKDACTNIGFFYIKNHKVPKAHLNNVIPIIKDFFNLPLKDKMKIHINKSKVFRGYTPLGGEFTNKAYDWHECVDFGLDLQNIDSEEKLLGPNQWPENQPRLNSMLRNHWDYMIILGRKITQGLAMSLGLPKNYFAPFMNKSHSYMRISNYPPINRINKKNIGNGIGSHIDYGFLTILYQSGVEGLQIKKNNQRWFNAPIIPGTFLINIGHMIQRWSNNYYKATIHRVVSPREKNRCSLPFFFEPNFDTIVTPLKKFCSEKNPPDYNPIHFGNYLKETFKNSYSSII